MQAHDRDLKLRGIALLKKECVPLKNAEIIAKLNLEQKCALLSGAGTFTTRGCPKAGVPSITLSDGPNRSEERRVGKECRSRWSPYH